MRRDPPVIEGSAEDVTPADVVAPVEPMPVMSASDDHGVNAASEPVVGSDPLATATTSPISEPGADETVTPPPAAEAVSDPNRDAFSQAAPVADDSHAASAARGWSNFATAIAVAVVIMAGAIIYLFYQLSFLGPDRSGEIAGLNNRLAALESRPGPDTTSLTKDVTAARDTAAQAQAGVASLAKRVDALPPPAPAQPSLQPQVTSLQGSVEDLKKSVADLRSSVTAIPRPDINRIESRFSDLDGRVATVQAAVGAIPHIDLGPLTGKVDAIEGRLKPLETEVQAAQSPQRVAERRAAPVAVTAQAIVEAIASGQAFPQEFKALQALGADPGKLAPLQDVAANGAPSLHDLQDDLAQAQDRILAQGTAAPSGSYMERLMSGATNLVQVRPLGSVVGDTPAAIVARIKDEIGADDLTAALADWQRLPEASRNASKALPARLKLRLDAETAARDIAANAIGALAAPRG